LATTPFYKIPYDPKLQLEAIKEFYLLLFLRLTIDKKQKIIVKKYVIL